MNRKRLVIVGSVLGVVVLLVAFLAFRPDKLFVDDVVDESLDEDVQTALDAATGATAPPDDAAPEDTLPEEAVVEGLPIVLRQGGFVAQTGHDVSGSVFVLEQADDLVLVLEELDSQNGPDLQLYLSPESSGSVDGGIKIAPLKGNQGTQSYELPDDIDLSVQSNVVIWCERFRTPFGTAPLT